MVTLSSAEAEYVAISTAAQDALWISGFLAELGEKTVPRLITYSESARRLVLKEGFSPRTPHIASDTIL
jgi:hypothetical protein